MERQQKLIFGNGLTRMVKLIGVPEQLNPLLLNTGVTVIVAITGALPVLVAIKEGIFPVPLEANPILELLLVQLNTVQYQERRH
jgi:hypothetical protein